ncbi:DUF2627 family protein [Staphylospora marina]|uniref:DUF2627 family protein n=1 Tax=Staphylospora marina TaxID=2490858 RepID=UPI000F5BE7FA|nr:DUF2627 family protein [Staphylospora marina]
MRVIYERVLAIIIMCIPGFVAVYGWTWMRDVLFDRFAGHSFDWPAFLIGLGMFLGGLLFLAGFLFRHDLKRDKIQPRLLKRLGKDVNPHKKRKPGY